MPELKMSYEMDRPECIQCGVCCLAAPCVEEVDKHGVCPHLNIENDQYTSCQKILEGDPGITNGFIGTGCVLRTNSDLYEEQRELLNMNGLSLRNIRKIRAGEIY